MTNVPVRLLYIHGKSEMNNETCYGQYKGSISKDERDLLELNKSAGKPWRPHFDGGAHADYALLSYFTDKYPPSSWETGDPEDQDYLDDAVCLPGLRDELEKTHDAYLEKEWDYIISFGFIEIWDNCLGDVLEEYTSYMKRMVKKHGDKLTAEQRTLIQNMDKILGLEQSSRDHSPERK